MEEQACIFHLRSAQTRIFRYPQVLSVSSDIQRSSVEELSVALSVAFVMCYGSVFLF